MRPIFLNAVTFAGRLNCNKWRALAGRVVAYSWRGGSRVTSPSDRAISLSREYGAQGGTPQFDLSASPPRVPHYSLAAAARDRTRVVLG